MRRTITPLCEWRGVLALPLRGVQLFLVVALLQVVVQAVWGHLPRAWAESSLVPLSLSHGAWRRAASQGTGAKGTEVPALCLPKSLIGGAFFQLKSGGLQVSDGPA